MCNQKPESPHWIPAEAEGSVAPRLLSQNEVPKRLTSCGRARREEEPAAHDYSQYQVDTGLAPPQHPHQHNLDCAASIKLTQLLTQLRPRAEVTLTRLTHFSSHRDTVGLDHQCLCMTSRTLFRRNSSHVFESWLPFQWEKNHHQCQKTLQSTTCPTHSKLMKEETPVVWTLQISAIRGEYSPCWVSPNTTCVQCGHTRGCFYKQCTTSGREGQATTTQFPP